METLADRIARDGPVHELDAIGWAIRLAKRIEALHQLGVAHGSVSPACILTAGQDRNARAYLADVQHTTPTPAYQSPERIMGGNISMADDVWALASTLYALLTGQSPFAGSSDAEVRQRILAASPAPLAVFDVGDDDLQHILDRSFARDMLAPAALAFKRQMRAFHAGTREDRRRQIALRQGFGLLGCGLGSFVVAQILNVCGSLILKGLFKQLVIVLRVAFYLPHLAEMAPPPSPSSLVRWCRPLAATAPGT